MKAKPDNHTENSILEASRKVFTQKGFAAARMEDIAREAGINRALLHYYFRSKEKLFDIIFQQRVREFFQGLVKIITRSEPIEEKIRAIVEHDIDMIRSQPDLPIFVLQELTQRPERMVQIASSSGGNPATMMKAWKQQVKTAVDQKVIRPIDGGQLLIHVMSLCVYPFIAKPMIKAVQELDDAQFDRMVVKRKQEVVDFVMNSIKP